MLLASPPRTLLKLIRQHITKRSLCVVYRVWVVPRPAAPRRVREHEDLVAVELIPPAERIEGHPEGGRDPRPEEHDPATRGQLGEDPVSRPPCFVAPPTLGRGGEQVPAVEHAEVVLDPQAEDLGEPTAARVRRERRQRTVGTVRVGVRLTDESEAAARIHFCLGGLDDLVRAAPSDILGPSHLRGDLVEREARRPELADAGHVVRRRDEPRPARRRRHAGLLDQR
jgi:hypothetical protein